MRTALGLDGPLLHFVSNVKRPRKFISIPDLAKLTHVELGDNGGKLWVTTQFSKDSPETFPAHGVEGFGQVDRGDEQAPVLFTTPLLKLPQEKRHIRGTMLSTEAALALV